MMTKEEMLSYITPSVIVFQLSVPAQLMESSDTEAGEDGDNSDLY